MNILLLEPSEVGEDGVAEVSDRRGVHMRTILKKNTGDEVRVGMLGGNLGRGTIVACDGDAFTVRCTFDTPPPPRRPRVLVLALPRPPVLRRLLSHLGSLGIEELVLLQTARVEKSYWQSPAVREAAIDEALRLGLEQAGDTVPPRVRLAPRFRPFVEDELPSLAAASTGGALLVAHPGGSQPCPVDVATPVTLVVGPEGGFVPFEIEALQRIGAVPVDLGPRILRVEVAVVALLARLGLG